MANGLSVGPADSFHLAAFFELDTAAAVLQDIAAVVNDNYLTRQNEHYWSQEDLRLMAAYVRDAGITNAQISTPDFRRVSVPSVYPLQRQTAPTNLPAYAWYRPNNIIVPRLDEIALLVSNDGAGGVACYGLIWLESQRHTLNTPPGDTYTLRATSTITGTAGQWTQGTLTFDQVLPAGTFTIVGMAAVGATTEAVRISFLGGGMRPGVICMPTFATQPWQHYLKGQFGAFGSFRNTAPPNIEVLQTTGAAVTYTIYFDVVLTGPG